MASSATSIEADGRTAPAVHPNWLLLLTTYGLIVSGGLLVGIRQARPVYALVPLLVCIAHALTIGPRGRGVIGELGKNLLTLGALGACLGHAHLAEQPLSYGLERFLIVAQLILLYSKGLSVRDFRLVQVMAIISLMAAGRWVREFTYFPAFLLSVFFVLANMLALELRRAGDDGAAERGEDTRSLPGLADFLTALWLPGLLVAGFTALFFVGLPRHERVGSSPDTPVGAFSEEVSLLSVGEIRQDETVAFRASFQPDNPEACPPDLLDTVLMRGTALFYYRGGRWLSMSEGLNLWSRSGGDRGEIPRDEFFLTKPYEIASPDFQVCHVTQKVEIEKTRSSFVFALYRPASFVGDGERKMFINNLTHHATLFPHGSAPFDYAIESAVPLFTPEQLRRAGTPPPEGHWPYLFAIPEEIRPEIERIADGIAERHGADTDYDRVLAVEEHLTESGKFAATSTLPDFGDRDPIVAFLTETRRGSCEQFATAMALLVRAWELPSRLVVGYKGGSGQTENGQYVFRERDGHTWVEIYFNGLGWVAFDPTPSTMLMEGDSPFSGLAAAITRQLSPVVRPVNAVWQKVLAYDQQTQDEIYTALETATENMADDAAAVLRHVLPAVPDRGTVRVVALVVLFLAAGVALYAGATWLEGKLRSWRRRPRRGSAVRFYEDMLRILRRKGMPGPPSAAPRELARRAAAHRPDLKQAVHLVTEIYCRVRFGNRELTAEQRSSLRDAIRTIKAADPVRTE